MARTIEQIVRRAAAEMALCGNGQTPPSYIDADLTQAYAEVYSALDAKEMTTWDSDADVPDEYVNPIIALVCQSRINVYKVPEPRRSNILGAAANAEFDISELQSPPQSGEVRIEYY